jgi:hypothetical protein
MKGGGIAVSVEEITNENTNVELVRFTQDDRDFLKRLSEEISDSYTAGRLAGMSGRVPYDPEKVEELAQALREDEKEEAKA